MSILYESLAPTSHPLLRKCYILNLSPWLENLPYVTHKLLLLILLRFDVLVFNGHTNSRHKNSSALNVEGTDSCEVILVVSVSGSTKQVSQIIFHFVSVFLGWNPVVISAILSFRAASSGEIYAEPSRVFLLLVVSLRETSILLWVTFIKSRHPLVTILAVCKVLVVPNIIIIISFDICRIFLRGISDLTSSRSFHPFYNRVNVFFDTLFRMVIA